MFQLHPKEEDYINTHQYCLHLWKPNNCSMIIPPINSFDSDKLNETSYFEHEGIIVGIKTGEIDGWKVARVSCFTKSGNLIKSGPNWDIMCEAKSFVFGDKDPAFQFMESTSNAKNTSLDIWYPTTLDLMPPLPDPFLVGVDKKLSKKR